MVLEAKDFENKLRGIIEQRMADYCPEDRVERIMEFHDYFKGALKGKSRQYAEDWLKINHFLDYKLNKENLDYIFAELTKHFAKWD